MQEITIGPRVRKSPFYDATIRHGARSFTIYNHTFMPMNYESDPEVEFSKLLNGVQIWDVGCDRQVQITGPDTMKLAQLLTPRNLSGCAVGIRVRMPICSSGAPGNPAASLPGTPISDQFESPELFAPPFSTGSIG